MAELDMKDALELAESLVTIGHPYSKVAIQATAYDLWSLCRGRIEVVNGQGVATTPKRQAAALIAAARAWEEGWPERGGTARLRALFHEMYPPSEPKPAWEPISYEQTLSRGLIRPPCPHCDDSGYVGTRPDIAFCTCRHGRYQKDWEGERGLQRINASEPAKRGPAREQTLHPFTPITEADMQKALEDERRRKADQLRNLGLD